MNELESVDVESAYGSEVSSNSEFLKKKDSFTIEDSTSRNRIRLQWLKYKLRDYMVLETVFFLILIFLLYRISSQNKETHETIMKQIISQHQETQRMILSIQSQLNSFQGTTGRDVSIRKEETEKSQTIINNKSKTEKTHTPPTIPTVSTNTTFKRINVASITVGSRIESSLSSSSNLNPFIGFDQSDLVLVDRPEPPADKAWCSSDKNPVLTVDLAKYFTLTAVSYQHSKWNETIPDDAPKEYSVVACLDNNCMTWKPLFSHCEYNPNGYQEQICNNISNGSINSHVGKLQFRFHKNHGNTDRTCVSLVRVYSTKEVEEKKFRGLEDTTRCIDLNHDYHHNPIKYKYMNIKTCDVLYSKGCCQECPECCEECIIKDGNRILGSIILSFMYVLGPIALALFLLKLWFLLPKIFLFFKRLFFK